MNISRRRTVAYGMRPCVFALLSAALLCSAPAAWGQAASAEKEASLAGKTVFARKAGVALKVGDKTTGKFSHDARVIRTDGTGLIVRHEEYPGPYEGRVELTEVVPLDEAIAFFTTISDPADKPRAFWNRALAKLYSGDVKGAFADLEESSGTSKDATYHLRRGLLHRLTGQCEAAIGDFREAVKLDPKNPVCLVERAQAWHRILDLESALADFDAALAIDPKYALALSLRGATLARMRDHERALVDLVEAIKLDPTRANAKANLGRLLLRQGKHDDAKKLLEDAVAMDPTNAWPLLCLGWFEAVTADGSYRDGQKALERAEQAIKLDGGRHAQNLDVIAAVYAELKWFNDAVPAQEEAIRLAEPFVDPEYRTRLVAYRHREQIREPVKRPLKKHVIEPTIPVEDRLQIGLLEAR